MTVSGTHEHFCVRSMGIVNSLKSFFILRCAQFMHIPDSILLENLKKDIKAVWYKLEGN